MPATRRLVLDLPVEQAERIDAEVASGRYPSPGAFIADLLAGETASPPGHETLDWEPILAGVAEEQRRIDANEARTYSLEEVFTELHERIDARAANRRAPA